MDYLAAKLLNLFYAIGPGASVGHGSDAPNHDPRMRYQMELIIGHGAYGYVYRAWDCQLGQTVAIKVINLEDFGDEIELLNKEIEIMNSMNCSQLVKYNSSYLVDSKMWIVMEYLECGSLQDMMKEYGPLDERSVAFVVRELLLALKYLHEDGTIHRDIKAGNLLVGAEGSVKLGDFGVSAQITDNINKKSTRIGSPFWMAPEVIVESKYDGCADIWSLGITCIELATGLPPYAKKVDPMKVIFLIPKNDPPLLKGDFSEEFKDFVSKCLKKEPLERATISVLLDHSFVNGISQPDTFRDLCEKRVVDLSNKHSGEMETLESSGMVRILSTDSSFWDFNSSRRRGLTLDDPTSSSRLNLMRSTSIPYSMENSSNNNQAFKSPFSSSIDLGKIGAPLSPLHDPSPKSTSPTSKHLNSATHSPISYSNALLGSLANLSMLTKGYISKGRSMSSTSVDEGLRKDSLRSSLGVVENKSLLRSSSSLESMPKICDSSLDEEFDESSPKKETLKRFKSMLNVLTQYPQLDNTELHRNHSPLFESSMWPSLQRIALLTFSASHDTGDRGNEQQPIHSDSKDTTDSTSSSKTPLEKMQQIQDITAILIGSLSALDSLTDGQLTIEFSTTLVSYMMKELEGNDVLN